MKEDEEKNESNRFDRSSLPPLFLPLPSPTNRVSSSYAAHNRSKTFCHAALDKLASERAIYALPLSPFQRHAFTSPVCLIGRYRSEAESSRDGRELFFSSFSFSFSLLLFLPLSSEIDCFALERRSIASSFSELFSKRRRWYRR